MIKKLGLFKLELTHFFLPITVVFLVLILYLKDSPKLQFEIAVMGCLVYVATALVHHKVDKSLTLEVIIEYILIALFAIIVLQSVLVY